MTTTSKPIIGTHNSMTYLRPRHWYGWLMIPFARCQRKPLVEQFWSGARCFDLRIRFTYQGMPYFAHGLYTCADRHKNEEGNPWYVLAELDKLADETGEHIAVRLILEDPKQKIHNEVYFRNFCKAVLTENNSIKRYPWLRFFGGNRKGDWKQIYDFDYKPTLTQYVSSMADDARWYERILPFAYALRKNKENKKHPIGDIAIYDFL